MKKVIVQLIMGIVILIVFISCTTDYYDFSSSSSYSGSCYCTSTIRTYGEYGSTSTDNFTLDKIEGVPCSDYNSSDHYEYGYVSVRCY